MSAFIMSTESLSSIAVELELITNTIGYNAGELKRAFNGKTTYADIFRELYRINELSVNTRYGKDNEQYTDITPSRHPRHISRGQLIKSLQCWMYQSCEFEGYKDNPVYNAIDNLTYGWLMPERLRECDDQYRNAIWQ